MTDTGGWTHTVTGGPWPLRRGLRCRVLTPFDTPSYPANKYPWVGLGTSEVIILIEDDPIGGGDGEFSGEHSSVTGWSCAIRRADVSPIDPAA